MTSSPERPSVPPAAAARSTRPLGADLNPIDARRYLAALRQRWWIVFLGVVAAAAISYGISLRLAPVYETQATLLVNFTSPSGLTYNDALLSQQLVKTYTQMAVQPAVLEQVAQQLGVNLRVDQLERLVTAQAVRDTQLFTITARSSDPAFTTELANTVAEVFIAQQSQRLARNEAAGAVSVIQPARMPVEPVAPKIAVNVGVAAFLALVLMLGVVYAMAWLDDTIKSADDAERAGGMPVLGVIPETSGGERGRVAAIEAYRLLRTAIDFASARQPVRSLVVTSSRQGEGKSTVVANLALAIAQAGRRVVVVDADLRKPALHRQFGVANDVGLTNVLQSGAGSVPLYLRDGPVPNLRVLTSGTPVAAMTELLQSPSLGRLLKQLQHEADIVVLDSPPVLAVADALVIARHTDAALLVIAANSSRPASARRARAALAQSGTRVLGTVLNRARSGLDKYTAYNDNPPGPDTEAQPTGRYRPSSGSEALKDSSGDY